MSKLRHENTGLTHFQNRYKSILCQQDACLLELVRYIHLNPLRARLVTVHTKSDERILGDGDFVAEIFSQSNYAFEGR